MTDQEEAGQADGDTHQVHGRNLFLEEKQAGEHGDDRSRCDQQGTDRRRTRQFDAVGLAEEIDERLAKGEQHESRQILFPDADAEAHGQVHPQENQSGAKDADRQEELHGNIQLDQAVTPDIGQSPQGDCHERTEINQQYMGVLSESFHKKVQIYKEFGENPIICKDSRRIDLQIHGFTEPRRHRLREPDAPSRCRSPGHLLSGNPGRPGGH